MKSKKHFYIRTIHEREIVLCINTEPYYGIYRVTMGMAIKNPQDSEKIIEGRSLGEIIAEGRAEKIRQTPVSNVIISVRNKRFTNKHIINQIAETCFKHFEHFPQEYIKDYIDLKI